MIVGCILDHLNCTTKWYDVSFIHLNAEILHIISLNTMKQVMLSLFEHVVCSCVTVRQRVKTKWANNLSLLVQEVLRAGAALAYLRWKCICGVRTCEAAHQSEWFLHLQTHFQICSMQISGWYTVHTRGFTPCRFHRDACLLHGVLNNSQLLL